MKNHDISDKRWDGYVPYLFRDTELSVQIDSAITFLDLIAKALERHFKYNEPALSNPNHFEELLISETFNRYQIVRSSNIDTPWYRISNYFNSYNITQSVIRSFPELWRQLQTTGLVEIKKYNFAVEKFLRYFYIRLHTLEVLLRNLPRDNQWVIKLKKDVNRFFAESTIPLVYDIKLELIIPLEEPLLQKNIDNLLLPRVSKISPERANEFLRSYHAMLNGEPADEIFINAYKTLEEFARTLTGDSKFEFKKEQIAKHYPNLHPTIVISIEKLNAHRGDEAGHGKNAPEEIRYLLFAIINIALLLLDYKKIK